MAKLASEAKKPDGLTIVPPGEEIKFLDQFELSDACGIGRATKAHLNKLNIFSFSDLRKIDQTTLIMIFKSFGLRLYNMARGIDNSKIAPSYDESQIKSISRSKTLAKNTYDREYLNKMGLFFCRKIAKQLRAHKMQAGSIGIYLIYGDFTGDSWGKKIKNQTSMGEDLNFHLQDLLKNFTIKKPIRKIGVYCGGLIHDNGQQYLSKEFARSLDLELVAEQINKKYARDLVIPATLVGLDFQESPSYGFKKNF
jgi:DNA polymerase-4